MGLKYSREYTEIIAEIAAGIPTIDNFYEFFDMNETIWSEIAYDEQQEILKTLADDLFYSLGINKTVELGNGSIKYLIYENCIEIHNLKNEIFRINLDSKLIN